MNQTDPSARSEGESGVETARTVAGSDQGYISKAAPYLWRGVKSGAVTAIIGGTGLLGGLRALQGGDRKRGLTRLAFGATFLAAALAQRRFRSRRGDPAVEGADEVVGVDERDHAAGEATGEVADTSPNVTSVETTAEEDTDAGDGTQTEEIDRLGEAAFDRQSREVPVPQRAFNQGFLAHSAEAFWGISSHDDTVLVSKDYDAIQGHDGVQYVASSEIGADVRELPIPKAVLSHWGEMGDGTAVTGGDDILFVTTDTLTVDGLLRVLPSEWATDLSG